MHATRIALILFFLLTIGEFLLSSCSGAPPPREEETAQKNQAAQYAESGNSYFNQGLYEQALSFFTLALSYNGAVYNEKGMIETYNSIGKTYLAMNSHERALASFETALSMARGIGDTELVAVSLTNKGELEIAQKNYDQALLVLQEAIRSGGNLKQSRLAVIYHDLGIVYRRMEKTDLAIQQFQNALAINLSEKNYHEVASNYYMLSSSYSDKGDLVNALTLANRALQTDKKFENSLGIVSDYEALSLLSIKAGKEEDAYRYLKSALFVCDSIIAIRPQVNLKEQKKSLLDSMIALALRLEGETAANEYRKMRRDLDR